MNELERRSYTFDVRAETGASGSMITGRPIVYDSMTDLGYFNEVIERGALNKTDLRDVRFLVNHDTRNIPLARSRRNNGNSTMQLTPDAEGLSLDWVQLDIDNNADAKALYSAVQRRDISGMSFMFSINDEEWENLESDHPTRRIKSIGSVVEVSDEVFVTVPVRPDSQTLAESHSMVVKPGDSIQEIRSMLGERFVNVSSAGAEYVEVQLMDMLRESIPSVVEPEYIDLISLSEAMYADFMAYGIHKMDDKGHEELKPYLEAAMTYLNKMSSYRNADGGFGWLRGMPSSETVTAVVLEHLAALRDKRLFDDIHLFYGEDALDVYDDMATDAVKYLDRSFFNT